MKTITAVQQYNQYACVAACLESAKRDFGDATFSHQEFVQRNSELFNGGLPTEGSCDSTNLPEVASRCGLSINRIQCGAIACDTDNEALVAFVFWNGDHGQKHFVRLIEHKSNEISIMNPQGAIFQNIPTSWLQAAFILKNKC